VCLDLTLCVVYLSSALGLTTPESTGTVCHCVFCFQQLLII